MTTETKSRSRKRRGRGEGSIFQRPDGRWTGTASLGIDGNRKRRRRSIVCDTKAEVQAELSKLLASACRGTLPVVNKMTVADAMNRWLDDLEGSNKIRNTTLANYRRVVKLHINSRGIGGRRLQNLAVEDVRRLFTEMAWDKVGPSPRRLAHIVLRKALNTFVKQGTIERNVVAAVDSPIVTRPQIKPLNPKQVANLLMAAKGDRLEALYHLALGSGMRQGEIFGLQWDAIDFKAGTVSVNQSLAEVGGKLMLGPPKSKASRRLIEPTPSAMRELEEHRKRQMAAGHIGAKFVFTNLHGGPLRRSHFHSQSFKPLLAKAGIPETTRFHDLRHTFASLSLLAGIHVKTVSATLGHSSINITLDTYSHLLPAVQTEAASRLDALMLKAIEDEKAENGNLLGFSAG